VFDLQPIGEIRRLSVIAGIATICVAGVMAAIVRAISRHNV
jgi:hypothetical protein